MLLLHMVLLPMLCLHIYVPVDYVGVITFSIVVILFLLLLRMLEFFLYTVAPFCLDIFCVLVLMAFRLLLFCFCGCIISRIKDQNVIRPFSTGTNLKLEVASRYRDPQLQVAENYSYFFNLSTNICNF